MKQITLWIAVLLAGMTINAQNIELSFDNAQVTNDGMDSFYEADIIITSDVTFSLGSGQFFLDYNTDAFGTLINDTGSIDYERPDTTILGGQTTVEPAPGIIIPIGAHYSSFVINDSSNSKVSFIWQQNGSGGMIGDNIPANTPLVLAHLKMKYLMGATAEPVNICFDNTNPFDDQFFTACGPFDPLVGFDFINSDCINEGGTQIFDYIPDCSGAITTGCSGITTSYTIAGGWSNGAPDESVAATINQNYDTSVSGDITACTLRIVDGATLTVTAGNYIEIYNDILVEGTLQVNHEGSVVQVNESAVTINDGDIVVSKTTPTIAARNYIVMSSPMSEEARDGVYGNARAVFSIIPSNFIPYTIDIGTFPEFEFSENFLDDNNDYLLPVTGSTALPTAGIGQLIFPSSTHDSPDASYDLNYTQGTLNSGTISVPLTYNGPETINNYNLLGNPYASAIDVTAFIEINEAISEVYYWDHLTNPSAALPGFGTSNFSMNDISMRNAMMGVAAVNGGTAPSQFMASGQGFGIKADQSEAINNTPVVFMNELRVTGNNDDFRSSTSTNVDKLWLNIYNSSLGATAQTAIGFTPQATAGYDSGYDSKRLGTFLSLFTNLNGDYLAIQGREAFDPTLELTLGFSTTIESEENYTISIDHLEGVLIENTPVFLIDHFTNTITNLKEEAYNFVAERGIQSERFTIAFQDREVLGLDEVSFRESIALYPNPARDQVTIAYYGEKVLQQLIITDINGKQVYTIDFSNFNGTQQINTNAFAKGIYFMHITSNQDDVVKKLIIR